jgi:hypothetical protein
MLCRLWTDEDGGILAIEIILAATILGIGVITGLTSLRDASITELADVGGAIAFLDQSFTLHGVKAHSSATAETAFDDVRDYCDDGATTTAERCLTICNGTFVTAGDITGNEAP